MHLVCKINACACCRPVGLIRQGENQLASHHQLSLAGTLECDRWADQMGGFRRGMGQRFVLDIRMQTVCIFAGRSEYQTYLTNYI